jgi:hypothetical protein
MIARISACDAAAASARWASDPAGNLLAIDEIDAQQVRTYDRKKRSNIKRGV